MEVLKTKATKANLSTELDLFSELPLSRAAKEDAAQAVGEFLVDEINASLARAQSPIAGEAFPKLSSLYAKEKKSAGFSGKADLERTGALKDAITFRTTKKGIEIGILDDQENAGKADGHCNFSGDSPLPQRRFLPDVGQQFKSTIQKEVERIVREKFVEDANVKLKDLRGISSQNEFDSLIHDLFPELTFSEAITAIIDSQDLYDMFDEAGLTEFFGG